MRKFVRYLLIVVVFSAIMLSMAYRGMSTRNLETQLFEASEKGDLATAMNLIGRRTNVNIQNEQGYTPMQLAARGCHYTVAEALFRAGTIANVKGPDGKTLIQTILDSDAPVGDKANMLSTTRNISAQKKRKTSCMASPIAMLSKQIISCLQSICSVRETI